MWKFLTGAYQYKEWVYMGICMYYVELDTERDYWSYSLKCMINRNMITFTDSQ